MSVEIPASAATVRAFVRMDTDRRYVGPHQMSNGSPPNG